MIGSLLYLTATRPDIQFSVCLCARFQASPRTSHRQVVKRIFRYLHHTPDWRFMVFHMWILPGVGWIESPLLGLASSWVLFWCLGLPANSRVLLNPLPRQSTLPQLVVALNSFGSHTPWVTLVRSIHMWQHQCHKCCKEPSAPFQNQAHRSEISFSERQCWEREDSFDPCTHRWPTSRYFDQTPRSSNFHSFAGGA
jgi:hypothetical protein